MEMIWNVCVVISGHFISIVIYIAYFLLLCKQVIYGSLSDMASNIQTFSNAFFMTENLGPVSIWRSSFPDMGIPMLKIRQSWDHLIFNKGIPLLVRWHLYIEMAPWFLHDWLWILHWIKFNELNIIFHLHSSQLPSQLWYHHQRYTINCDFVISMWTDQVMHDGNVWKSSFSLLFMGSSCHIRNKIMYILSWHLANALTLGLFWCLFPSWLHNSGNKHQNYPLVSA